MNFNFRAGVVNGYLDRVIETILKSRAKSPQYYLPACPGNSTGTYGAGADGTDFYPFPVKALLGNIGLEAMTP